MTVKCSQPGCPNHTDEGLCVECAAEIKWGVPSDYRGDGSGERRIEDDDDLRTDGGVQIKLADIDYDSELDESQSKDEDDEPERPNWNPNQDDEPDTGARSVCQNCGSSVSRDFARVFGDNEDRVDRCLECSTFRDVHGGRL